MFSFLDRWRPRHLATGWVVYWLGLAAIKLGPPLALAWRLTRSDDTGQNTITFGFSNATLNLSMTELGKTLYVASASLTEIALWTAVPPLLLLGAWLLRRSSDQAPLEPANAHQELGAGLPESMKDQEVPRSRSETADSRRSPPGDR